ncbi:hypothetical protein RB195_012135 [Necator americanus]|uniref:Uncharacterized protein n=1 Tax=Necator americanus TaxID=51031 RepID=A0ABR1D5P0_NECAM
MPVPLGAISTGLGLVLYFWLLIFLDGLLARLMGTTKGHIHYSREDRYNAEILSESAALLPNPLPTTALASEIDSTQDD